MTIFGKLDAETIPTNPFFIEKGNYDAEVVAAKFQTNRDQQRQLYIQYMITEDESQYDKSKCNKLYNIIDEDMTAEKLAMLPADEMKKIRGQLASLKRDLCGSDGAEDKKGLGIDLKDLDDANWDPAVLVGLKVTIGINNFGANNEGVNIRWVNLREE